MRLRRLKVKVSIDGRTAGVIVVPANATERHKVLAAMKLPGVRARLLKSGVKAARSSPRTYEIFSRLPVDLRRLKNRLFRGKAPAKSGFKRNPYRGLGLPR